MWLDKLSQILGFKEKKKPVDEFIIIAAYHEAGHALMAFFVGWGITSINLNVENGLLTKEGAITNYNFNGDQMDNQRNIIRRIYCVLAGPVSERIYTGDYEIKLDKIGPDGEVIDNYLANLNRRDKEIIIQDSIKDTFEFMNDEPVRNARQNIADVLINNHTMSYGEFIEIVNLWKVPRTELD